MAAKRERRLIGLWAEAEERETMSKGDGGENSRIREEQVEKPRGGSVFRKQPGWHNRTKRKEAGGDLENWATWYGIQKAVGRTSLLHLAKWESLKQQRHVLTRVLATQAPSFPYLTLLFSMFSVLGKGPSVISTPAVLILFFKRIKYSHFKYTIILYKWSWLLRSSSQFKTTYHSFKMNFPKAVSNKNTSNRRTVWKEENAGITWALEQKTEVRSLTFLSYKNVFITEQWIS